MPTNLDATTTPFPRILDEVRRRVSTHQFETWFGRVALSSLSEKDLVIAVPNAFHQEWMGKEFRGPVGRAAAAVLGREVEVRFVIDPALRGIAPSRTRALDAANDPEATLPATPNAGAPPAPPAIPTSAAPSSNGARPFLSGSQSGTSGSQSGASQSATTQSAAPRPVADRADPDDLAGPFPTVLDPRHTFENFILGPSNQIAYAAARAVADNPSRSTNPLFIYGSVGLGKTHLLQAICHELLKRHRGYRIVYLSCEVFTNQFVHALQCNRIDAFRERYRKADMLVVDDIHFLAGKERTQDEFFHTFNALHQHGRQIVLSSDAPPSDIPTLEERLISRFKWGLVERLERPETETRMAILRHKAESAQLALPDDVVEYVTSNVKDNVREIEGALASIRTRAELEKRPVDLALARQALEATLARERPVVGLDRIVEVIGAHFGVKASDLKSSKRTKSVSFPRQVVMHAARRVTTLSLEEIGDYFGGRDHTTVLYAVQKVDDVLQRNDELRSTVNSLVDRILAR